MNPPEHYFDLYFDHYANLKRNFETWKMPLAPLEFHNLILELWQETLAILALNPEKESERVQYETEKIYEVLHPKDDLSHLLQKRIEQSEKFIVLLLWSRFDGVSRMIRNNFLSGSIALKTCFEIQIIDVDEIPDYAKYLNIRNIPVILIYYRREVVLRRIGYYTVDKLNEDFTKLSQEKSLQCTPHDAYLD